MKIRAGAQHLGRVNARIPLHQSLQEAKAYCILRTDHGTQHVDSVFSPSHGEQTAQSLIALDAADNSASRV